MPDRFINWEILGNPLNWLVIWLVLFAVGIAVTAIYSSFDAPSS